MSVAWIRSWWGVSAWVAAGHFVSTACLAGVSSTFEEREEWSVAGRSFGSSAVEQYGKLLRSHEGVGPRVSDSPFLDAALLGVLPDVYGDLYVTEKQKAYEDQVRNLKTVALFDGFVDLVASGEIPPEMKSAAHALGPCLARKISAVRDACPLKEPAPGVVPRAPATWKLAAARASCGSMVKSCWIRRSFFAAAYPDLVKYRDDPKVREMVAKKFEELFPVKFFEEFRKTIDQHRSDLSSLIAPKMNAQSFVEAGQPLIQADGPIVDGRALIRMDGFAYGLMGDILVAKAGLREGASPQARDFGATGLWSIGQRLIELTGIDTAVFADGHYDWRVPTAPGQPPGLGATPIGGWSAYWVTGSSFYSSRGRNEGRNQLIFQRWDWEQYYKLPNETGSVTRIFPHAFQIDSKGIPQWAGPESAEHRLEDLALLADAVAEFLAATQKGAVLSKYFGSRDELKELLNPQISAVLPRELRSLAYGVLAAIARNLVHPDIGVLDIQDHIEPGKGLGVRFFEKYSFLESRDARAQASTISVARLILAASKMRSLFISDPELPLSKEELPPILNQIDSLIQIGALTLGADAQVPSGGFRPVLGSADRRRLDLESSLLGLRAIQAAYGWSRMPVLKLNLNAGMKWLKTEIQAQGLLTGGWSAQDRVNLWHWISLWDEAEPEWRDSASTAAGQPDWAAVRSVLEVRLLEAARSRADMNR